MLELTTAKLEDGIYRINVSGVYVGTAADDGKVFEVVNNIFDSVDAMLSYNMGEVADDAYKFRRQLLMEWIISGNYSDVAHKLLSEVVE